MNEQLIFPEIEVQCDPVEEMSYRERAQYFCEATPYRKGNFAKRNWGGNLHSLCSYQGKLKPSIAHFLVSWFTNEGETVLDPMSGVGTVPFEARRLNRIGIANDLSPLAYTVSSAKLESITEQGVETAFRALCETIDSAASLDELVLESPVDWGLNKSIRDYFHPRTLREILAARNHFASLDTQINACTNLLEASILHILHGNRPYALSRRSHPVTPLAPTGPFEYRSLVDRLSTRLAKVVPELVEMGLHRPNGHAYLGDLREVGKYPADAIITSPPFAQSLRFWSSNWMRLWFSGWDEADFKSEPRRYLESEQKESYEPYRDFFIACAQSLSPGGRLILHLGETAKENMVSRITPLLEPEFNLVFVGRENVEDTESHGLSDKGATVAHWYLFAEKS